MYLISKRYVTFDAPLHAGGEVLISVCVVFDYHRVPPLPLVERFTVECTSHEVSC